jgi:hypothetical protein
LELMDFSKLSSNDKLAVYGAVAAIIGAFLGFGGGASWGLLTGIAMLVIIFLPQLSPATQLPGSKGSLMVIVGGVGGLAALFALLGLLTLFGAIGGYATTWMIGLLLSAAGGALMAWASWREFQAEGGKFNLGMANTAPPAPPAAPPAPPMAEPMAPPMAKPMAPPMAEPMEPPAAEPMAGSMNEPMGGERSENEPPA